MRLFAIALTLVGLFSISTASADDIVDTAIKADGFDTLVAAVKAAGLVETLKSEGPFTVFAPTDDAFAALPAGALADLLKPENKAALVKILTYHVVPGRVTAADVVKLDSAKTVQGSDVKISIKGDHVMLNAARTATGRIKAGLQRLHSPYE